jgi:uncharacterized membrane-anchored protein
MIIQWANSFKERGNNVILTSIPIDPLEVLLDPLGGN